MKNYIFCLNVSERIPHSPIFKERLRNQTVSVDDTVVFRCRILSDLQPYIQWLKYYEVNGSLVSENNTYFVKQIEVIFFALTLRMLMMV